MEKIISELAIENVYSKLPTSRMKFIVAAHFELGYTQEFIARILGVSQATLNEDIAIIRGVLIGKPYRPHKAKGMVKIEDVFKLMMLLKQP